MGMLRAHVCLKDLSFSLIALGAALSIGACSSKKDFQEDPPNASDTGLTETISNPEAATTADARPMSNKHSRLRSQRTSPKPETHHYAVHSRAPKIAAAPFQAKDGRWLNAFYFVRSSDESWQSLSKKFYGRPDRAEFLKNWNRGRGLAPGEVVYYNSPSRPEDSSEMKVFAQDFGMELESVVVQKDDWLSKIGESRYGDARDWHEIAALNPEISNPDLIEIGQRLRVQPIHIDTAAALQKLLAEMSGSSKPSAAKVDEPKAQEAKPVAQAAIEAPPTQFEEPPPPIQKELPKVEEAPPIQKKLRPSDKVAMGPPDYAMIGAGLVAGLALALLVLRRLRARKALQQMQEEAAQATDNVTHFPRSKTAS